MQKRPETLFVLRVSDLEFPAERSGSGPARDGNSIIFVTERSGTQCSGVKKSNPHEV